MPESKRSGTGEWTDPDDAPELDEEFWDRAEIRKAGIVVRRGRPPLEAPKRQVTVRLDADVLDRLRAGGPGWQTRMNEMLRRALDAA